MLCLSSTTRRRAIRGPGSWGVQGGASSPLVEAPQAPDRKPRLQWHGRASSGRWQRYRQRYAKGAAVAGIAAHRELAAVRLDDAVDDGEPETGSALLGGEEGVEDALQVVGADAFAGI